MTTPSKNCYAATIKELRANKEWKLEYVSKLTGIPLSTLNKLENGQSVLNIEQVEKICKAFNITMEEYIRKATSKNVVNLPKLHSGIK